jgi:uncharacterized delta-60 repeat protein
MEQEIMNRLIAAAGSLDRTFNKTGVLFFALPQVFGVPRAVLALPGGKTLVAMENVEHAPIVVARLNEDGSLDRTFGPSQHGFVEIAFEDDTHAIPFGLSLLASGGWLISGQYKTNSSIGTLIIKQLQDGQLDTSFNGDGKLFLDSFDAIHPQFTPAERDGGEALPDRTRQTAAGHAATVVEQADGKIVLLMSRSPELGKGEGYVLRRNADGSPDAGFGGAGYARIELPGVAHDWSIGQDVAVQADGQILVCGTYIDLNNAMGAFVTRLNSTGQLDQAFNGGYPVKLVNPDYITFDHITVRENDGRIVVVGNSRRAGRHNGLTVVLNRSGSYNLPFNHSQPLYADLVPGGGDWKRCAQLGDGSIVVAGGNGDTQVNENTAVVTARYLADGALDLTFNPDKGFSVFNDEGRHEDLRDMALMADGRIVLCGRLLSGGEGWMLRYLG